MDTNELAGMTPWDFAAHLQKQYFGTSDVPISSDACDLLATTLLSSLPGEHRRLLERVPLIVLPTRDPNAYAISGPPGVVIAIDYGLLSLLGVLNRLVLDRVALFGMEPGLPRERASDMARDAVRHFLGGAHAVPRWPMSPKKMLLASALSGMQAAFVVCHELGHIALGHIDLDASSAGLAWRSFVGTPLAVPHPHEQEFEADGFAVKMIVENLARVYDPFFGSNEPAFAQAGIPLLFSYLDLVDRMTGAVGSTTHPPIATRREKVREQLWPKIPDPSRRLAEQGDDVVRSFFSEAG